jgi:thiosulfate/3-mercaptopyruvate sulfurtransferase
MTKSEVISSARSPHPGEALVGPNWLAARLAEPTLRVVEVDVSAAAYQDWHVDGAVLWNVYTDLKDPDYRLTEQPGFEDLLGRSAITPDSTVVFYGYAPALGFWLMKLLGHDDVRILDCSRDTWRAEGHPWNREPATPRPGRYRLSEQDRSIRADRAQVEAAMARSLATLVDVRSEPEYRGERFWPSGAAEPNGRAGHIPGAIHQPIDNLYDRRGAFRPTADLRQVFSSLDEDTRDDLITYCTIGGRAATAWFVLTYLLGRDHVRVYDGSWAEWGRATDTVIEAA